MKQKTVRKLKEGEERGQESILENEDSEIESIIHPGVYSISRGRCDCAGCDNSSFSVTLLLYQICSCLLLYLGNFRATSVSMFFLLKNAEGSVRCEIKRALNIEVL